MIELVGWIAFVLFVYLPGMARFYRALLYRDVRRGRFLLSLFWPVSLVLVVVVGLMYGVPYDARYFLSQRKYDLLMATRDQRREEFIRDEQIRAYKEWLARRDHFMEMADRIERDEEMDPVLRDWQAHFIADQLGYLQETKPPKPRASRPHPVKLDPSSASSPMLDLPRNPTSSYYQPPSWSVPNKRLTSTEGIGPCMACRRREARFIVESKSKIGAFCDGCC